MRILASPVIMKFGNFDVTLELLILAIISLCLLIAIICFFINYRTQMKVSLNMDAETAVYSRLGVSIYLKKNKKKLKNPTFVVAQINNLEYLYKYYNKKNLLMTSIADCFLKGLNKLETLAKIDDNKFLIVLNNRPKEEVIKYLDKVTELLDNLEISYYGRYNFDLLFAYYDRPNISNPDEIRNSISTSLVIIPYSNLRENNVYYYVDLVAETLDKIKKINEAKDAALLNKQFVSYIQPKLNIKTGKIVGGEILVRWQDSNGGNLYYPDEFIPLFESTGFISKVDLLMIENTCSLAQMLVNKGYKDISISVNLSKADLNLPDIVKILLDFVNKYQISTNNIEIEITETMIKNDFNFISKRIMEIRQAGFLVSMDDFGQEYSSLGLLTSNSFDIIKMDRIFFKNKMSTDKEKTIAKNILSMLKTLNYEVVCEGIEDKSTIDYLATISNDIIIQGYYISKPIPLQKFESFLNTNFDELCYKDPTPEVLETTNVKTIKDGDGTTININSSGLSPEILNMKHQMDEMKAMLEKQARDQESEREKLIREREAFEHERKMQQMQAQMDMMNQQMEFYKNQALQNNNNNQAQAPQPYPYPVYGYSQNQQIDVEGLFARLKDSQKETMNSALDELKKQNKSIQDQIEDERKERESLEALLKDLNSPDEPEEEDNLNDEEILNEQQFADEHLNLDENTLTGKDEESDDADEDDTDESDEEESKKEELPQKSELTLSEIEAIIKDYQNRFKDDWMTHAKEELQGGFDELVKGLKFYQFNKNNKKTFVDKVKKISPEMKQIYNIVKNELMHYNGVTNRLTKSCDVIYKGRNQLAKISFTKSRVRLYLALDPNDEAYQKIPHKDLSNKKTHQRTPFYTLLKSSLSVKRAKKLIADLMENNNLSFNESYKSIDYATKYKFFKKDQRK